MKKITRYHYLLSAVAALFLFSGCANTVPAPPPNNPLPDDPGSQKQQRPVPTFEGTFILPDHEGITFSFREVVEGGGYNGVYLVNGELYSRVVAITDGNALVGNCWFPDGTYAPFAISDSVMNMAGLFEMRIQKASDDYSTNITPIPAEWLNAANAYQESSQGNGYYSRDCERRLRQLTSGTSLYPN